MSTSEQSITLPEDTGIDDSFISVSVFFLPCVILMLQAWKTDSKEVQFHNGLMVTAAYEDTLNSVLSEEQSH